MFVAQVVQTKQYLLYRVSDKTIINAFQADESPTFTFSTNETMNATYYAVDSNFRAPPESHCNILYLDGSGPDGAVVIKNLRGRALNEPLPGSSIHLNKLRQRFPFQGYMAFNMGHQMYFFDLTHKKALPVFTIVWSVVVVVVGVGLSIYARKRRKVKLEKLVIARRKEVASSIAQHNVIDYQKLSKFELLKEGFYGEVFQAQLLLDVPQDVAVKKMKERE